MKAASLMWARAVERGEQPKIALKSHSKLLSWHRIFNMTCNRAVLRSEDVSLARRTLGSVFRFAEKRRDKVKTT